MPFYILQISDLHIGGLHGELEYSKRIMNKIIAEYSKYKINLLIIITGDLIDQPDDDFSKNAKILIDDLVQRRFRVWPVPGNNDFCLKSIWISGSEDIFEHNYIMDNFFLSRFRHVPYPHAISDLAHQFFALNSMDKDVPQLDHEKGAIGSRQLENLGKKLKTKENFESKNIVFLHHHPFNFDHLIDRRYGKTKEKTIHGMDQGSNLMQQISGSADILIFGHEHVHCDFSKSSYSKTYNIPVILSCGKSTQKCVEYHVSFEDNKDVMTETGKSGLLGWKITIEDDGKIVPETVVF